MQRLDVIENWKIQSSSYLFKHKYLTIRKDSVVTQNGTVIPDFYVIENPDWINVIALTEDGMFVMEQQYRHGIGTVGYEICAGMIEECETPLEAAKRELLEETGYSGGEWVEFMQSTPNPSSMNNTNYTFLAREVKKTAEPKQDITENIKVVLLSSEDVFKLLLDGNISEGIMQAPLWKYFAMKEL